MPRVLRIMSHDPSGYQLVIVVPLLFLGCLTMSLAGRVFQNDGMTRERRVAFSLAWIAASIGILGLIAAVVR